MADHTLDTWESTSDGLAALIEKLPVAAYTCDPDGLITYFNPAALRLWGRAPKLRDEADRFCGSFRLFSPDGQPIRHDECWMALALRTGRDYNGREIMIERPDGQRLSVLAHAIPVRSTTGEIAGAVNVLVDITARKAAEEQRRRLEQQMRHTQKLEGLGVFAGSIAHDFNNLLTPVLGYARLATRDVLPGSNARRMLDEISAAAKRASDLSKQLLAYSGRGEGVHRVLSLDDVVRAMKALLETVVSKTTTVEFNLAPATVWADASQIRQIVMNLITNASEALDDEPGVITVRTGVCAMNETSLYSRYLGYDLPPGRYAYVKVADTGPGMAPETLDRIFDPFFTTKLAGRGLGLASVLGIVRAHGGTMQVKSAPGDGTTFEVYLPSVAGGVARDEPNDAVRPVEPPRDGTLLVVEDEDDVRTFIAAVLDAAGFDVLLASDGRIGLEMFSQHSHEIDAVVLDLTMPEIGGWELAARLQEQRPELPIVLMSGYEPDLASYGGVRLAGFLEKPFSPNDLVQQILDVTAPASGEPCGSG